MGSGSDAEQSSTKPTSVKTCQLRLQLLGGSWIMDTNFAQTPVMTSARARRYEIMRRRVTAHNGTELLANVEFPQTEVRDPGERR